MPSSRNPPLKVSSAPLPWPGSVELKGCVPSKTLIRTANLYYQMKNARKYGLPQKDVPPVDYRDVSKRIETVIRAIQQHDSPERFCKLGAQVEFGNPIFTDEHSIRLNGKTYSAKTWVIATGSSPLIPPIEGLDKTPYITNREIYSLDHLPESMIILGAGPVATEMAQAFCRLGTRVYVIQRSAQILTREDKEMADTLMNVLSEEGVTFYLNARVLHVRDLGKEREISFQCGEEQLSLRGEVILVAMGREANLHGLELEVIGVEFDRKGLKSEDITKTEKLLGDIKDFALTSSKWPGKFGYVTLTIHGAFFGGEKAYFIRSEASDMEFAKKETLIFSPRLSSIIHGENTLGERLSGDLYLLDGQEPVLSSIPGRDDYTPVWSIYRAKRKKGSERLHSVSQIRDAEKRGDIVPPCLLEYCRCRIQLLPFQSMSASSRVSRTTRLLAEPFHRFCLLCPDIPNPPRPGLSQFYRLLHQTKTLPDPHQFYSYDRWFNLEYS